MSADPSRRQPNILFVMADQLTAALTGAYGHPVVRTPNLDRLVAEGIRFDAAYSNCPVCLPARGALMSGRYISNCKTYDNGTPWPQDMVTLPHYLTLAGYDTVLSGKMHFVGADQLHGFARRLVHNIYPADYKWTPARQDPFALAEGEDPEFRPTGGQARQYIGKAVHVGRWRNTLSYDEETHFRALEYLHAKGAEGQRTAYVAGREFEDLATMRRQTAARPAGPASAEEGPQPFFLCVSYHHPHEPFWPPRRYWDLYEGQPIDVPERREDLASTYSMQDRWLNDYHGCSQVDLLDPESATRVRRAYYALVTYVDDKVGQLLDSLHENGLAQNTIVVFTSDHGDMLCEKGMVQKRCFYEWSARVPLIVRFPDRMRVAPQAGRVVEAPVSLIDLLPTLLDLAGVEERLPYDGRSLLELIDGGETAERVAMAEIHSEGIHGPCFMIRQGQYKYIYVHRHDEQLFDLRADPGEWHNLAGDPAYADLKRALKEQILAQFDPDAIDAEVEASIRRRQLIRAAMARTGTRWDVAPSYDPRRDTLSQYLP